MPTTLTLRQRLVLETLVEAGTPLKTKDLRVRTGLLASQVRAVCNTLLAERRIAREIKLLRQRAGVITALKRVAFWSLPINASDLNSTKRND